MSLAAYPPRIQGQWTVDDIDSLPDDLKRYELWDGELIIMPAPTIRHQMLVKRLVKAILANDPEEDAGEVLFAPADVVLSSGWVVQPDILYVRHERRDIIHAQRIWGAPDLVIEVLSPRTTKADREGKREAYERAGVQEYWLVDHVEEEIRVLGLDGEKLTHIATYQRGDVLVSRVLPDLRINISSLFDNLPE